MRVKEAKVSAVTAGEIRAACEANPSHPVAAVYLKAAKPFPDDATLHVEAIDLVALIDGAEVVIEEAVEDDARVQRKAIKPKPAKPLPAPAPAPKPN